MPRSIVYEKKMCMVSVEGHVITGYGGVHPRVVFGMMKVIGIGVDQAFEVLGVSPRAKSQQLQTSRHSITVLELQSAQALLVLKVGL